jgi:benzoate transport
MKNTADETLYAIKNGAMSRYQIWIVTLCTLIAALDGFDVLVVAYTGPAISGEWALAPTDLGLLFGAGLAGMGVGAVTVAPIGDWLGRRPTILLSLWLLFIGMGLSAYTEGLTGLAWMRFFTGLGIGAVLANVNIMVSEYSSARRKALCVSLMAVGYPIGATLGGLVAVYLISSHGWRSVYLFGAAAAAVLLPLVWLLMPESLDYLLAKRPSGALEKCNRILQRMGHPPLDKLPEPSTPQSMAKGSSATRSLGILLCACGAYFAVMMTCYFLLSWTPQILTRSGMTQNIGISGSLLMNLGGIAGCLLYGVLSPRVGARGLAAGIMVGLFFGAILFAAMPQSLIPLLFSAVWVGVCLFSSINALYVLVPQSFAAGFRSTGTGIAMGAGRLGAVAGPIVAGHLIALGLDKTVYIAILALPMLVAALLVMRLRPHEEGSDAASAQLAPESSDRPIVKPLAADAHSPIGQ